jgi:hypothetical protein
MQCRFQSCREPHASAWGYRYAQAEQDRKLEDVRNQRQIRRQKAPGRNDEGGL